MSDFLTFMGPPTAACIMLAIVFTYFGCHVLKREIIFIDLSLAQVAALGTTLAFMVDIEPDSPVSLVMSFLFVVAGSVFFSRTRNLDIPQEAVIGIVYVVSASAALLMLSQTAHGAEHLKALLNGSILWVGWGGVLKIFCVILFVAALHWVKRMEFLKQSETYRDRMEQESRNEFLDFLFFLTLGLVIVVSVKTAGIFLIFTLLIIPASCGALFSQSWIKQLMIGSILGIAISLIGLIISYYFDLPTGATLVCTFGIAFIASLFLRGIKLSA